MNEQLLSDDTIRRAFERRASVNLPADLSSVVLGAVARKPQRWTWQARAADGLMHGDRPFALPLLVGVALLVAAMMAVALIGSREPLPQGSLGLPAIVIEHWNGLQAEASRVGHLAFAPGETAGTPVTIRLPANATALRWSPDGKRLAFVTAEDRQGQLRPSSHGLVSTGLIVAGADGADPRTVSLPRPMEQYTGLPGWDGGAQWAPGGELFAYSWTTFGCDGGEFCIPPSGIDVFDAAGTLVKSIDVINGHFGQAIWSPDGLALGWFTGACGEGWCATDAFHWQRVRGDAQPVTNILLENASLIWAPDGLLHGVNVHLDPTKVGNAIELHETVGRVFTIKPDASDLRDLAWVTDARALIPRWSPDGRRLATIDHAARSLTIHDTTTGMAVVVSLPVSLDLAAWAPDGGRIVLFGPAAAFDGGQVFALYAVNVDGTGLVSLGEGEDFAWAPPAMLPAP